MDKFTVPLPKWRKNSKDFTYKQLSFFIFKGKAYKVGSRVELTELGKKVMRYARTGSYYIVEDVHFSNDILTMNLAAYKDNMRNFSNGITNDYIEKLAIRVIDLPIDDNHLDYIDFIKSYKRYAESVNFTKLEKEKINYSHSFKVPLESLDHELVGKVKRVEKAKFNAQLETAYKDWECPEVVVGWVVLIIAMIFFGIFKKPVDQIIFRGMAIVGFLIWRHKRIIVN